MNVKVRNDSKSRLRYKRHGMKLRQERKWNEGRLENKKSGREGQGTK